MLPEGHKTLKFNFKKANNTEPYLIINVIY